MIEKFRLHTDPYGVDRQWTSISLNQTEETGEHIDFAPTNPGFF